MIRALRPVVSCLLPLLVLVPASSASGSVRSAVAAIKVNRKVGPPTSSTLVQGRGFGPTETVDIDFDRSPLATATTDPSGAFQARIQIPASSLPGRHHVQATGECSGLTAQAPFIVNTDRAPFHFGPARTGFNPYENVLNPSNVSGLHPVWRFAAFESGSASPAVSGGVVYLNAYDLYAL